MPPLQRSMWSQNLERRTHPWGKTEEGSWKRRRLDEELGRSSDTSWSCGRGCEPSFETRSRGGGEEIGRGQSRESREGERKRKIKEKEKEEERQGGKESEIGRWQKESRRAVWRDWLRSGPGHQKAVGEESSKDPERFQEEKEKVRRIQQHKQYLEQFVIGSGGHGGLFRGERDDKDLEEGPGSASVFHYCGSAAKPPRPTRSPSRHSVRSTTAHHGPVLQEQSTSQHDSCPSEGVAPLVHYAGPHAEGRGSQGLRFGLSEAEIPRRVFYPYAGAAAPGESLLDFHGRSESSGQACLRGAEDKPKDPSSRKGRRKLSFLGRWQERQRKRRGEARWKERSERGWKAGPKREGGSQAKELLRGELEDKGSMRTAPEGNKMARREELGKGQEDRSEKTGVPGGVDSWEGSRAASDNGCMPGESMTFDTRAYEAEAACLPKGSSFGGIHCVRCVNSFSDVLGFARDVLLQTRSMMCKQLTTVKEACSRLTSSLELFPLPASLADPAYFSDVLCGLNDLADCGSASDGEKPSEVQEMVKKNLRRVVDRFDVWGISKPEVSFQRLFTTKDVDYSGEEIKVAMTLTWPGVKQSLPDGVGLLPLQEYCRLGTLHYVTHFEEYLLPEEDRKVPRAPKVMVESTSWDDLCRGLVEKNICEIWPIDALYHCHGVPLLNGLFAVGKGESQGGIESQRLIMNLTPLNSLCRSIAGDVSTLPGLTGFSGFLLEDDEVALLSSEDIRCFFYLFSLPEAWKKYLGFNREVSPDVVPSSLKGKRCVLVARVLPMGFLDSVGIAQHVHRNIVRWSAAHDQVEIGGECELRKDRPPPCSEKLFRIYLDNFDQVERTDPRTAEAIVGTPSAQILQLRQDYETLGLPRHPKKAVERAYKAEIQGAVVDGKLGYAIAKPQKIWQYALLAIELLERGECTLKELQIVCGGFVCLAMFRRQLLGCLNEVWQFMQSLKSLPSRRCKKLTEQVKCELARFILLIPLAQMDFRSPISEQVTCSDASSLGGGICVSEGLTAFGVAASNSQCRGDVPEPHDLTQVLTVGLFDGLGALRLAADAIGLPMAGHVSIEKDPKGRRVVESWFPDTLFLSWHNALGM